MKTLIGFVIGCLICSNLYAQIRIDDSFESTTLENQMSIFRDSTKTLTIDSILKNETTLNFIISKISSPSFGYDSSSRWVHFRVINTSSDSQFLYIRIYRSYLDKANFYFCYHNEVIQNVNFRWQIPHFHRQTQSKLPAAHFLVEPNKYYDIYILAEKKGVTWSMPVEISSKKYFMDRENTENLFYGLLGGGAILSILMSFFLFSLSKDLIYLYYSLYSACSTLALFALGGFLNQIFGHTIRILTGSESYSFYILGFISFNILFTHLLFDISKNGPKWLYFLGKTTILLCLIFSILFIYDYNFVYKVKIIYVLFPFGSIIIITIGLALIRGDVLGRFYFIAFFPLLCFFLFVILSEVGIIHQHTFLPLLGPPFFLFEITVLLAGLAFRLYDFQRKKQELESEMIFQVILSQETERQRIAQDLHDEVGNSLAALKNYISQTNLELGEKINKIAQDVRNISHNLASIDFEKTTLSITFQNLINRHNEAESIDYELIEVGESQKLAAERELVIYRIVCELLNNIQKHSKAQKATVQLIYEANLLTIIVEDDGIGIKNKSNNAEGIGLKHIQTRVAYLNAKLTIDDDGKGTIVVIDVPIST